MTDSKLRSSLIRLAHTKPELRSVLLPLLKKAGASDVPVQFGVVTQDDFPNAKWTITGRARELYYSHIHKPGQMPRWERGRAEKMLVQMWLLSKKLSKSGTVKKSIEGASGEEFDRKTKRMEARVAKSRLGEYGHGEHERDRLASGKVLISVDVPATMAAREKYSAFESIVVARFEQSTPLYRIFDGKELQKILASGKITGGTYSARPEREFGASWGANISAVINFGNRQRGSRLGDKLYLAKIDGLDFKFAHLDPEVTFDLQGPDEQEVHMNRERCSPALGCSLVNVSLADVDALYEVFPNDRIERRNLRDLT